MGVLQLQCINSAWADQRRPTYYSKRRVASSASQLACAAGGGAWPFLVGGVIPLNGDKIYSRKSDQLIKPDKGTGYWWCMSVAS